MIIQRLPISSRALLLAGFVGSAFLMTACEKEKDKTSSANTSAAQPATTTTATSTTTTKSAERGAGETGMGATGTAATTKEAPATSGKPVVTWKGVGLSTPESVLHDAVDDVYLVSNIEGKPLDVDGKAFITRLSPDGTVSTLKWIEGGKNKVTLNAPKGMAIVDDRLYVADIDTVRIFDRKTGAPVGDVKIPGATFLNDLASTADGRVLVTDTGMKSAGGKMEPSGTDGVYAIDKDKKVTTIAKSKDLGNPNGIVEGGDKVWVVTMGTGELYSLDAKGKKGDVTKLPKGTLDGVVVLGPDDLLVSSWDASAVFRGKPGSEMKAVIEDVKSPADIGYDKKRGRVLVPLFNESEVRAYDLK